VRFVSGPDQPLLAELRAAAEGHSGCAFQAAVAWANDEGVALLLDATVTHVESCDFVVGINNQGTTVEGLLRLLSVGRSVRVLYQHPRLTFHPKAYFFDDGSSGRLVVGSSNLTAGGLDTNFEASVVLPVTEEVRSGWGTYWRSLSEHQYSMVVATDSDVERLYRGGYVIPEAAARVQHRRASRRLREFLEGQGAEQVELPTAAPTRRFRHSRPAVDIPFDVIEPAPGAEAEEVPRHAGAPSGEGRRAVFVRTLTPNDVAKLHGDQSGTFEPDIGLVARDEDPDFWGWPNEFERVIRTLPRDEREVDVRLYSRVTGSDGIPIRLVIWFREAREGHPAEFRISPRPISEVRSAVPEDFDIASLLVVQRAGKGLDVHLLTPEDASYDEASALLSVVRPAHRYGYGS